MLPMSDDEISELDSLRLEIEQAEREARLDREEDYVDD